MTDSEKQQYLYLYRKHGRYSHIDKGEIFKLEKLLKQADIPHFMIKRMGGYQIFYPDIPDKVCTVTQGKKDEKLKIEGLETQKEKVVRCLIGEAVRLTASEAYRRIREHYEGKNERKSKKFTGYHK